MLLSRVNFVLIIHSGQFLGFRLIHPYILNVLWVLQTIGKLDDPVRVDGMWLVSLCLGSRRKR